MANWNPNDVGIGRSNLGMQTERQEALAKQWEGRGGAISDRFETPTCSEPTPLTVGTIVQQLRDLRELAAQVDNMASVVRYLMLGETPPPTSIDDTKATPQPDGWLPLTAQSLYDINLTLSRALRDLELMHRRLAQ